MAQSKFTIHKYVKLGNGCWRYKKAALYSNGKIKPNVVIVGKDVRNKDIEETHAEGRRRRVLTAHRQASCKASWFDGHACGRAEVPQRSNYSLAP